VTEFHTLFQYTHVLRDARDAHREPNIIRYSTQEAQHIYVLYIARALYHRKPIKKRRNYHFIELISSLKRNGWAACGFGRRLAFPFLLPA